MTAEELLELPDDGMRHELVEGELRTMTPAGGEHGQVALRIGARILDHVDEHGLGAASYAAGRVSSFAGGRTRSGRPTSPSSRLDRLPPPLPRGSRSWLPTSWSRSSRRGTGRARCRRRRPCGSMPACGSSGWSTRRPGWPPFTTRAAGSPCCVRTEPSTARTCCPASGSPWRRSFALISGVDVGRQRRVVVVLEGPLEQPWRRAAGGELGDASRANHSTPSVSDAGRRRSRLRAGSRRPP